MITIRKRGPKVEPLKVTMDLDHLANRKPKRIGNPNLARVKPVKTRQGLIDTMRPVPIDDGTMVMTLVKPLLIKASEADAMGIKRKKREGAKKVVD